MAGTEDEPILGGQPATDGAELLLMLLAAAVVVIGIVACLMLCDCPRGEWVDGHWDGTTWVAGHWEGDRIPQD